MLEPRSPLEGHAAPGGAGPLTLGERAPGGLIQIAGWPESFADAAGAALAPLGFARLGDFRLARVAAAITAFRIAPERIWLTSADGSPLAEVAATLDPALTPVLDLGHARWVIRLGGPALDDLLARLVAIDVAGGALPVAGFAQTGIEGIGVLAHRLASEQVELYVPTTFALALWDLIRAAATPFGYGVAAD